MRFSLRVGPRFALVRCNSAQPRCRPPTRTLLPTSLYCTPIGSFPGTHDPRSHPFAPVRPGKTAYRENGHENEGHSRKPFTPALVRTPVRPGPIGVPGRTAAGWKTGVDRQAVRPGKRSHPRSPRSEWRPWGERHLNFALYITFGGNIYGPYKALSIDRESCIV